MMIILSSFGAIKAQLNTDRIVNMGRNALYFEDYVLSIQYFNLVVSAKPFLADPYYFRAVAKYYLEDHTGAIMDCNKALDIDPFLVGAYELRGIAHQRKEMYDLAAQDFSKGLKYDQDNTNLMFNLGLSYLAGKKFDEAIAQFDLSLKYKRNYATYLSRGAAYLEKGDTVQALNDYAKAIDVNPYNMSSYARRGYLYIQSKKYEEALEDFNMAINLEPRNANLLLARGVVRYYSNDLTGSIEDYSKAIQYDPNNVQAYYNRAMLRAYIGDDNKAVDDYSVVLELDPENNFALLNRALLYVQIGRNYAAIADLSAIITAYPSFPVAYYARAEAKQALGDKAGAEKDFGTAYILQQENKDGTNAQNTLAQAIKNSESDEKGTRKSDDKDIKSYKRIVYSDNEDEEAAEYESAIRGKVQNQRINNITEGDFYFSYYEYKGDLERQHYFLRSLEDYNQASRQDLYLTNHNIQLSRNEIGERFVAIDALSTALDTQEDAMMYYERGMNYSLVKNFADALNDLNKANELKPNDVVILFSRASVRQRMVDFIRSVEAEEEPEQMDELATKDNSRIIDYDLIVADYNKLIALQPDFAFAWYNKGNVMNILKNYKAAINDYSKAIAIEPRLAEAYYNRGLTYIFLGETERGLTDLSKAGELGIYKAYNVMKRYGN